ncbi:UNVERIFIED_ORG: hypothetical protein J2W38_005363 [Variovorax paradoxus]|nr:hypothetical protein [Variovorax paradoxus]
MAQLVVLEGYLEKSRGKATSASLLLVDGTTLTFSGKDIVKAAVMDTSTEPMTRVFLDPETDISLTFKAKDLMGGGGPVAGGTITKWLDDGGTISKSRDDGFQVSTIAKYLDDGGTISKSRDDGG